MPDTSRRETSEHRDGPVGLCYVGDGSALPDVPGRDLTADEIKELVVRKVVTRAALLSSGLYAESE